VITWENDKDFKPFPGGLHIIDWDGKTNERIRIYGVIIKRTAMGLHVKGTNDLVVKNSEAYDNGGLYPYYHNGYFRRNDSVLVENSRFHSSHTGMGLNLTAQKNVIIRNSEFYNNRLRGIRAADSENLLIESNRIMNNNSNDPLSYGLLFTGDYKNTGVQNFIIRNNTITRNRVGLSMILNAKNGLITANKIK
jgi:polygalacturonase